ncbi:hypothetical protein V6N13_028341 [Hibiscus sabdariffa]
MTVRLCFTLLSPSLFTVGDEGQRGKPVMEAHKSLLPVNDSVGICSNPSGIGPLRQVEELETRKGTYLWCYTPTETMVSEINLDDTSNRISSDTRPSTMVDSSLAVVTPPSTFHQRFCLCYQRL